MPPPAPAPRHHHHFQAASSSSATIPFPPPPTPSLKPTKKRGSYNCGLCGLPKKGHICSPPIPQNAPHFPSPVADSPRHHHKQQQQKQLPVPRALSFDELAGDDDDDELGVEGGGESEDGNEEDYGFGEDGECGVLPRKCVWEVMRKLPPRGLMAAGGVCRGWRECSRRIWKVAEELRLRVPARGGGQIGFVGSVLERCSGLVRLSLRIERLWFVLFWI